MGSLFAELARQASANARREVEAYVREIPELGLLDASPRDRAETLEYALWLRRRTNELAPSSGMLTEDDLAYIASMGETRADAGMSLESRQQVLRLHTALMLREINEATDAQRGGGVDELMQMMGWFAPQGVRGIGAYCQGFVRVLRRRLPYVEQVALLARSLLTADPMAAELALAVGMELPEHCAVTVIRVPDRLGGDRDLEGEIEALVKTHQVPVVWCPQGAGKGGELIALVPVVPGTAEPVRRHAAPDHLVSDRVSDLVRDFAEALGRPCAAGTATAPASELADALDRARRISRAAPLRRASARLRPHTLADVFVELAVADVPFADDWLQTVARRLASGPDLLVTLDAYYGYDMSRGPAAAALNVHPRTLDYRLRRVQELTGIDPGSTHGVRILSSVVARRLSGAWR
ncbi:CdaR family transcriptional regulator [Streptomyces sp. TLI_146]|uniref:PucR family transcriptional regulator n=1 Tax=Streptomyces sp. TLI_146 TaxID=1938858 RepID=UPI000C710968|nr:helix-turn-helix domain-containing protein [Streptomyces sp. TLI_146]